MTKDIRINQQIRVPEVRLIDFDGKQLGVVPTRRAIEIAVERELDLVEVAPTVKPPVCKIMDFGKYKYQMGKKHSSGKKTEVKEIKVRPRIDKADLERKTRDMVKFLEEGHKTKVTMFFRGREKGRPDLGMQVFVRIKESLEGKYNIMSEPMLMGNSITMVVAPK